jgi:hypothetical protein
MTPAARCVSTQRRSDAFSSRASTARSAAMARPADSLAAACCSAAAAAAAQAGGASGFTPGPETARSGAPAAVLVWSKSGVGACTGLNVLCTQSSAMAAGLAFRAPRGLAGNSNG